ncbi:uncharacterized protein LOC128093683 [Culex pipiens pallens]|uniref:uncharacterized protein LOC128093683 n=1 Tax=Culex pipiens pallens TaxID=42434 RepID=UPI0022AB2ED3|nr:uncharacterized protein LOC128093683 [Culex pipiens pallens]
MVTENRWSDGVRGRKEEQSRKVLLRSHQYHQGASGEAVRRKRAREQARGRAEQHKWRRENRVDLCSARQARPFAANQATRLNVLPRCLTFNVVRSSKANFNTPGEDDLLEQIQHGPHAHPKIHGRGKTRGGRPRGTGARWPDLVRRPRRRMVTENRWSDGVRGRKEEQSRKVLLR